MKGCIGTVWETQALGADHISVQGPAGGAGLNFQMCSPVSEQTRDFKSCLVILPTFTEQPVDTA